MNKLAPNDHCFACGEANPHSLHLRFFPRDGRIFASFTPTSSLEGYEGIVHGGILSTLLDEAMIYAIRLIKEELTVTAKLEISFKSPAKVGEELMITGNIINESGRLISAEGKIARNDGSIVAFGKGTYVRPKQQ